MKKIVNTRKGFTLAEILISLVILGVIAALTIPTLIQNTQKKEEVVKIKKGLSMINQAASMYKAMTDQDAFVADINDGGGYPQIVDKLKKYMSVTASSGDYPIFRTSDGLAYLVADATDSYNPANDISASNYAAKIYLFTDKGLSEYAPDLSDVTIEIFSATPGVPGTLTGTYEFFCGNDRCVPSEGTAAIINASDPTKVDSGS